MSTNSIELSKKIGGKIEITAKRKLFKKNLSILYTPGVADVSLAIAADKKLSYEYTIRKNTIAVISDGSAVLGLGNIGPEAALPVMEGKALLFKELGGVDAFPIVLNTQDPDEIVDIIKNIAPTFGGINLEDISSPRCFYIEERLKNELDIPVFHDDQHGTAIVTLAGLINACKVVKKSIKKVRIVISGAGAAGIAVTRLLYDFGIRNIIMVDTCGAIYAGRKEGMNEIKVKMAEITNKEKIAGSLQDVIRGADVFIGVSAPSILKAEDISKMNSRAIVFAMSNPISEIMPREAKKGGAEVIATGRSDYPNQINNVLVFPGIFRGALDKKVKNITKNHKLKAAKILALMVKKPTAKKIIPDALDREVPQKIAKIF